MITKLGTDYIECDEDASKYVDQTTEVTLFTLLSDYRAMLKLLGGNWVTTHFRENVKFSNTSPEMILYILKWMNIDLLTFHSINWTATRKVGSLHKISHGGRTSKMMYGWLPVGHNWNTCNLELDKCPCCGEADETFANLLACKHEELKAIQQEAYLMIQQ